MAEEGFWDTPTNPPKNLGIGQTPFPLFGNAKIFTAPSSATCPLGMPSAKKKSQSYGHFPYGGGRGQTHSIAFGGVFPNITEAILND